MVPLRIQILDIGEALLVSPLVSTDGSKVELRNEILLFGEVSLASQLLAQKSSLELERCILYAIPGSL